LFPSKNWPESMLYYPDDRAASRYAGLVGMEHVKFRVHNELALWLAPERLAEWSDRHGHHGLVSELAAPPSRAPVIVLAGDSGTGKTSLAESLGDPLARSLRVKLRAYRVGPSLGSAQQLDAALRAGFASQAAGVEPTPAVSGHILIYDQQYALETGGASDPRGGPERRGVMDRVVQAAEMLAAGGQPAAVILCVSHPSQVDVAVRRLTSEAFVLARPGAAEREVVLRRLTEGLPMTDAELVRLVRATGPRDGTPGYTYGDLAQRLMHAAILASYPDRPLTATTLIGVARRLTSTPTAGATTLDGPVPPAD
jgi:hypothetical protein